MNPGNHSSSGKFLREYRTHMDSQKRSSETQLREAHAYPSDCSPFLLSSSYCFLLLVPSRPSFRLTMWLQVNSPKNQRMPFAYHDDDGKVKFLSRAEKRELLAKSGIPGFKRQPLDIEQIRQAAKQYGAKEDQENAQLITFKTNTGQVIKFHHPYGTIEIPGQGKTRRNQKAEGVKKVSFTFRLI